MCAFSSGVGGVSRRSYGLLALIVPACGVRGCLAGYLGSMATPYVPSSLRIVMMGSKDGSTSLRVVGRFRRGEPSVVHVVSGGGNRCNSYVGVKLRVTGKGCFEPLSTSS